MTEKEKELLRYLKDVWKRVAPGIFIMLAVIFALIILCIFINYV